MKKNIIICLSLMLLTIVCYIVTVKVMQNADTKSSQTVMTIVTENGALAIPMEELGPHGDFIFKQPYKILNSQTIGAKTLDGKMLKNETSFIRKWTITGPVYGRITKIYENGQLTSETHMKVSRQEVM